MTLGPGELEREGGRWMLFDILVVSPGGTTLGAARSLWLSSFMSATTYLDPFWVSRRLDIFDGLCR
jgi:hypothetical protein